MSLVAVRLHDGDTEVARAPSLRIRVKPLVLPGDAVQPRPDLTVHLLRPPVGEWIGMRTASHYGTAIPSTGAGFAESAL